MNNLPATQSGAPSLNWDNPQVIRTLKATVAQGATDDEFVMFAQFCKATGLNPMKKEAWFIKVNGRVQIMTGINGYWQIANSHPMFDGTETGMINSNGDWVKTVAGKDFIGAWCKVYRKDRRLPMEGEALLADYQKNSGLWNSSPRIMIKKVAQSIALRQAFSQELNGVYTAEEMPQEYSDPNISVMPQQPDAKQPEAIDVHPQEMNHYDLTGYPVEKLAKMVQNLLSIGATQVGENTFATPKTVKNLEAYLVQGE